MPDLGVPALLIILVFGMGKLPQIGNALGQGIRESREGTQGLAEEDMSKAGPGESVEG